MHIASYHVVNLEISSIQGRLLQQLAKASNPVINEGT